MTKENYVIGDKVENIVELTIDNLENTIIPVGTTLRIVAIAPKVCMMKKDLYHDGLPNFFNAVIFDQENDYYNRIRANFCTIRKAQ